MIAEAQTAVPAAVRARRIVKRVLVVGAGEAGTMVVRELRRNPQLNMQPIGFLDDDTAKAGKRVQGLPVLGPLSAVRAVVTERDVTDVVIAMPTVQGSVVRGLLDECRQLDVKAQALPGVFELLGGAVSVESVARD